MIQILEPETKAVPGIDGFRVSACGRVFSNRKTGEWREIEGSLARGYRKTCALINGKEKTLYYNVLVAMAWLPDYDPKLDVHHKDGNKTNNHVTNLAMMTRGENCRSKRKKAEGTSSCKLGVSWSRRDKKWCAHVWDRHLQKNTSCGAYDTEEEGAFARDLKAVELGYDQSNLNYPENYQRYRWEVYHKSTPQLSLTF